MPCDLLLEQLYSLTNAYCVVSLFVSAGVVPSFSCPKIVSQSPALRNNHASRSILVALCAFADGAGIKPQASESKTTMMNDMAIIHSNACVGEHRCLVISSPGGSNCTILRLTRVFALFLFPQVHAWRDFFRFCKLL